ncbi:MAG: deoxyribodipyrimidine photolyase-related protein [Oceanicaulis sp. HLUCCA04]|nr:MAG: deoxyribodipyrimidine photolyase-related protein [Oceanicaulis sp. HLUCCA04]
MSALRLVLGDQLSRNISALDGVQAGDLILLAEVNAEASYVPHHRKKIAFVFSAMRHFADALRSEGLNVRYVALDDDGNTHSLEGEVDRALNACEGVTRIIQTEPGEYRLMNLMRGWPDRFDVPVEMRRDDRFICTHDRFARWAKGKQRLTMEYFYREMRRETGLLMDGDEPEGGQWNFDAENRKALPAGVRIPERSWIEPDPVTREVMTLVENHFPDGFGDIEPFGYAVTRKDALDQLDWFIAHALPDFGDYQDALKHGEAFLFHSVLSLYLNCGLLDPMEVCKKAEAAWLSGKAPLNAVEGFIRQILGWREYVRGIYWLFMPEYLERNALNARRPLPEFYWSADTAMACIADVVTTTRKHAYAHHIQRLMVTGNFALLAGIDPKAVNEWYLAVYADAYEWVEAPNTHGMALYADGGIMATKPYAASGAYINRMSDHCGDCRYDVKAKTGEQACPFNYLYWNFMMENEERLKGNRRLGPILSNLKRFGDERRNEIRDDADRFFEAIGITETRKKAS